MYSLHLKHYVCQNLLIQILYSRTVFPFVIKKKSATHTKTHTSPPKPKAVKVPLRWQKVRIFNCDYISLESLILCSKKSQHPSLRIAENIDGTFIFQSSKLTDNFSTLQKVTPMGLSHNNMDSSLEISVYVTVITKTDGQGAKKWHHIRNGLNTTGSCGAERSYARLCGSWESYWWPFAVQSQTHLKNYVFLIDFMLKLSRKKTSVSTWAH